MSEELPAGTQSVGRALAVLKLLASSPDELTGSAIAAELQLSSGTANRLIRALIAEGLVARNPMSDSYYLGSGTVLLGQAAQRGFGMDKALPILEQLNSETQESVNLSIRQGPESVVMMRVQSTLPLRFEQHTGARFPCTRRLRARRSWRSRHTPRRTSSRFRPRWPRSLRTA